MTAYQHFRCDLCTDYIEGSDTTKKGFGFYLLQGGSAIFKPAKEADRHICVQCAASVHEQVQSGKAARLG